MKKILLALFAITMATGAYAGPVTYKLLRTTNNWSDPNNWAPKGTPLNGDRIVIPTAYTLTLTSDISFSDMVIDIYGKMILSGSNLKANFSGNTSIIVHTSGAILGTKASQQIVFGNNIILKGATAGNNTVLVGPQKASMNPNIGFVPFVEPVVLAVKFVSFSVVRNGNATLLNWVTAEERNTATYQVQRSKDGKVWENIAVVFASGQATNAYSYNDKTPANATVYYRIKELATDGTSTLSAMRVLNAATAASTTITAASNHINIQFAQAVQGRVTVAVVGLNGTVVVTHTATAPAATLQVPVTGLHGIYVVQVSNGTNLNNAKQVLL